MPFYDIDGNEIPEGQFHDGPIFHKGDDDDDYDDNYNVIKGESESGETKEVSEVQKSCTGCLTGCGCMAALVGFIPLVIYVIYLLW